MNSSKKEMGKTLMRYATLCIVVSFFSALCGANNLGGIQMWFFALSVMTGIGGMFTMIIGIGVYFEGYT